MANYNPGRDLRWLLLRPWLLIDRLVVVLSSLLSLALVLVFQANNPDPKVQQRLGQRIFSTLTGLGPCFIKVGQALSTRPDLVRRDWLDQLTQLQDNLPAFPHAIALQTIEADLGAPVQQLFEEFPEYPVAAASLGQVYRAKPVGGHWVAVKVQRPQLELQLRRDLVLIRLLGVMAAPLLPLNLGFGLGEIIDEFGRSLFEEIDYRKEADNAERFARMFEKNAAVIVPRVDRNLSGERVLTTTWINGTKLQQRQELEAQQLDPAALIRTGVVSGLQQLLEFGYFHADPHPGNLFALPGKTGAMGHVAYVDFGMMDSVSNSDRLTLTGAVVHLINRDFEGLAQDFVDLGFLNAKTDLKQIIPALEEVLGGALGENVGSFNFKAITDRFSELMYSYPFRVPARFALIIRAVVSQEGLAMRLDPSFRIINVAYPYVARRLLAGDTAEMREKLLEVLFDQDGRLQLERLENLLQVVENDDGGGGAKDLLPVAGAGLKLLVGEEGKSLRQRLLLTLVRDNRLNTDDLRGLMDLMRRTFSPKRVAGRLLTRLNPLAARVSAICRSPMSLDPINLSEAAQDFATGDFGDLEAGDFLLEFAPMFQPPYVLAGIGLAMGILCGLTFAKLVQNKLDGWKQDRLALLPLGNFETNLPYTGIIVGITLFIGGSLQIFGFASGAALLVAFVLSMATAGALWVQLERLMTQVENGTFSAVDFDNFDEFF